MPASGVAGAAGYAICYSEAMGIMGWVSRAVHTAIRCWSRPWDYGDRNLISP